MVRQQIFNDDKFKFGPTECYIFSQQTISSTTSGALFSLRTFMLRHVYHIIPCQSPAPGYGFQISRFPD